ncbi:conserved hypothetical protein [Vibrio phage 501E54-1]|nr:conserved hypothetical protein [Vibrio phage 501E54-1]
MHQHENYDDNSFGWVPEHNVLSTEEMNERVYPEFQYKADPDSCVEATDEFMKRMVGTYRPYDEGMWLVDDEHMFMNQGIYRNEWDQPIDGILDCDKMGSEVNTIIENMKGSY